MAYPSGSHTHTPHHAQQQRETGSRAGGKPTRNGRQAAESSRWKRQRSSNKQQRETGSRAGGKPTRDGRQAAKSSRWKRQRSSSDNSNKQQQLNRRDYSALRFSARKLRFSVQLISSLLKRERSEEGRRSRGGSHHTRCDQQTRLRSAAVNDPNMLPRSR